MGCFASSLNDPSLSGQRKRDYTYEEGKNSRYNYRPISEMKTKPAEPATSKAADAKPQTSSVAQDADKGENTSRRPSEFSLSRDPIEKLEREWQQREESMDELMRSKKEQSESVYKITKEQHTQLYEFAKDRCSAIQLGLGRLYENLYKSMIEDDYLFDIVENLKLYSKDIENCMDDLRAYPINDEKNFYSKLEKNYQMARNIVMKYNEYKKDERNFLKYRDNMMNFLKNYFDNNTDKKKKGKLDQAFDKSRDEYKYGNREVSSRVLDEILGNQQEENGKKMNEEEASHLEINNLEEKLKEVMSKNSKLEEIYTKIQEKKEKNILSAGGENGSEVEENSEEREELKKALKKKTEGMKIKYNKLMSKFEKLRNKLMEESSNEKSETVEKCSAQIDKIKELIQNLEKFSAVYENGGESLSYDSDSEQNRDFSNQISRPEENHNEELLPNNEGALKERQDNLDDSKLKSELEDIDVRLKEDIGREEAEKANRMNGEEAYKAGYCILIEKKKGKGRELQR